jgi:hypothetical protein
MKKIEGFAESETKSKMHAMNMRRMEEYENEIHMDISLAF